MVLGKRKKAIEDSSEPGRNDDQWDKLMSDLEDVILNNMED